MSKKKIAVITGGSSGIGKAISDNFLKEGYIVVNADIKPPSNGGGADYVPCDVTLSQDMEGLYHHVISKYGIPDALISNAGQGIHEKISEGDPEKWARVININVMGSLRFVRAFLPEMLQRKKGDIIFISSTAGNQVFAYGGIYSASKAALNMVAKTLRLEVEGILRVCLVCPGVVDTSFFRHMIGSDHGVEEIGWGSLSARQVAELVSMIVHLPESLHIPEISLCPPKQPL